MRVLFLNPVATLGGAERVLLQCLKASRTIPGVEPILLAFDDGPLLDRTRQLGIAASRIPAPATLSGLGDSAGATRRSLKSILQAVTVLPELYRFRCELRQKIAALKPDLVHSNGIKTHLLGAFAVPAGIPIVWHLHDFYSFRRLAAPLLKLARRGVRAGIAISRAVARDTRQVLPGLKIDLIPNTIDSERFSPGPGDGAALDRLSGLPPVAEGVFRVGLVAAYARWKGQDVFLKAIAERVRAEGDHQARYYIIGGPLYRTAAQFSIDELRSLAVQLNVADRVAFVPFLENPAEVYRALDLVVHASTKAEPFGLTIAEAMACGRAVVISHAGGAAELYEPEREAIGVAPGNPVELARTIARLQADPGLRERLGHAARQRAERDFESSRLGPQLAALYCRVLRQ